MHFIKGRIEIATHEALPGPIHFTQKKHWVTFELIQLIH